MMVHVKSSEFPFLADWFAITYRWLIVLSLAVLLVSTQRLDAPTTVALALPTLWNLVMTVLAAFNRRMNAHRAVNFAADLLFSLIIFVVSGNLSGPAQWAGVLGIAPASIFYEIRGASLAAVLITLLEGAAVYFLEPALFASRPLAILTGINLSVGLTMGLLSLPLIRRLRDTYHTLLQNRREHEQRIQMRERERMKALFDMIATFSATLNYKTALEAALNSSVSTMALSPEDSDSLLSAFFLFDHSHLRYIVGRGFPARDQNVPLPAQSGVLGEVLRSGEHRLVISDTCADPELCKLVALHSCRALLVLPLIRGMNAYGVLLYAHPSPTFFDEEKVEWLLTISNQAVIAIQNARLFQDLAEEKERIVQSQEEAQKKLARDLHDGPTQSISAIAMRLSIARRMFEQSPRSAMEELAKIEELARRTTQEIRHMLFTLRPLVLESEGLIAALQTMAEKMRDVYQQNVVLDVDPAVVATLDANQQTVIFYLVEEAVNNARKHAEATRIQVLLKFITGDRSMAGLEISDNGRGFDVAAVMGNYEQRGSLGMINLQERADLINGLLKVDSAPGKGTRIRVYIPLTEAALDRLHQGARK
uniref:GAF domain-containing protein n=1 Tax=Anaerolinea thermolimosa TaxID=229919 RepID=A0A7C4PJX1_9CHLR